MNYIITGGAGFIGSHLIDVLIRIGHKVTCIDDLSTGLQSNLRESKNLFFLNKKIQNISLNDLDENYDGIFHLAAQTSVPISINKFFGSSSNNLQSSLKVLNLANELKIPVVYASSSAVYGNLAIGDDEVNKYDIQSPYAQDKLSLEHYAKMCWDVYKTPSIGLRFFNVYGPRQDPKNPYSGVISIFIERLLHNKPVTVNGGFQTRDFIFVDDIVQAIVKSMNYLIKNRIFEVLNVGTGITITISDLLQIIANIYSVEPSIILRKLPKGDPKKSSGMYNKLNKILKIDINKFTKLRDGLISTTEFIKKDQNL